MSTSTSDMIRFVTGLDLPEDHLWSKESSDVERMMVTTVEEIHSANRQLIRAAQRLRALAEKIEGNVNAPEVFKSDSEHRFFPLNPSGEVQGGDIGRVDALIAEREAKMTQLKLLVQLHRKASEQA